MTSQPRRRLAEEVRIKALKTSKSFCVKEVMRFKQKFKDKGFRILNMLRKKRGFRQKMSLGIKGVFSGEFHECVQRYHLQTR